MKRVREDFEPEIKRLSHSMRRLNRALGEPELPGAIAAAYEVETAVGGLIDGLQAERRGGTPGCPGERLEIEDAA